MRGPLAAAGMGVAVLAGTAAWSTATTLARIPDAAMDTGFAWLLGVTGMASLMVVGSWFVRQAPATEEETSFQELRRTCRQNDPLAVFAAHTRWLATLEGDLDNPVCADLFASFQEWEAMQLASESGNPHWSADSLLKVLEVQRASFLSQSQRSTADTLLKV